MRGIWLRGRWIRLGRFLMDWEEGGGVGLGCWIGVLGVVNYV
jgi:hypothetical protein